MASGRGSRSAARRSPRLPRLRAPPCHRRSTAMSARARRGRRGPSPARSPSGRFPTVKPSRSPAHLSGSSGLLLGAGGEGAPEEELGALVQCAHAGARQPLAQGGPIFAGEASAAQLQLLQERGDLVPEARAQGALDGTACRREAGAGLRELLPARQNQGSPAGASGGGGRLQGTPKPQPFIFI